MIINNYNQVTDGIHKYFYKRTDLLLGGNQGEVLETFRKACGLINGEVGKIIATSSVYQTKAWGVTDQPDFLNAVISVMTAFTPEQVLQKTQQIETSLGRIRYEKWGARMIDIDILFMEDMVLELEELCIPHAQVQYRKFTLEPMEELRPDYIHPVLMKSMKQINHDCPDTLDVKKAFPKESLFDRN